MSPAHASRLLAGDGILAYLVAVLTDLLHSQRDPLALCLLLQSYDKVVLPCCQQLSCFSSYYSLWIPEPARGAVVSAQLPPRLTALSRRPADVPPVESRHSDCWGAVAPSWAPSDAGLRTSAPQGSPVTKHGLAGLMCRAVVCSSRRA